MSWGGIGVPIFICNLHLGLQVPVVGPSADVFVLRDVLHLPTASTQQGQPPAAAAGLRLQLLADPSAPERLYAVHAHGGCNTVIACLDSGTPMVIPYCMSVLDRCEGR